MHVIRVANLIGLLVVLVVLLIGVVLLELRIPLGPLLQVCRLLFRWECLQLLLAEVCTLLCTVMRFQVHRPLCQYSWLSIQRYA